MRSSYAVRTLLCTVGSLGLAVTLLGCETQNISATTTLPPLIPAIVWIVALDITTVPKEHFPIFRDEMLPALVLGRTQRGDEIHTMPVDSDPEQHVRVTGLIRNVGFEQEIAALFGTLQSELVHPERYQGTTNLGGVVSYGKRTASWFREDRARPRPSGSPPPPTPAFVLMIFTDGHPEGRQTLTPAGEWPDNVSMWFWGVERQYEVSLKKWATTEMGLPVRQVQVVRFTDGQNAAPVFGPMVERPTPRPELLKQLRVSQRVIPR